MNEITFDLSGTLVHFGTMSSSKVKVVSQRYAGLQEENVTKIVRATSSKGILIHCLLASN